MKCAGNYCRRAATVVLVGNGIRITLCERHAAVFRRLGYEAESSSASSPPSARTSPSSSP